MRLGPRATRTAVATLRRLARITSHDIVPNNAYSPIPAVPPADDPIWTRPASLVGIDLDTAAHLRFLETECAAYLAEFDPPTDPDASGGFHLRNGYYQAVDAEVLYAMIRHLKPARILEIGSGYSTLVTAAASARNAAEGQPAEFTAVDPEPRRPLRAPPDGPDHVIRAAAQELPLERFLELGSSDVLFVDSSHTVKLGSEVNFLVLEVLQRLRPGVVVHFHDVFLPYEYPRAWYERGTFLAEHYLLQAFLIGNAAYEVLFAAHAVARAHRDRLSELIPSLRGVEEHYPAAFWMVRTPAPATRSDAREPPL